jgi:hypothetical protein
MTIVVAAGFGPPEGLATVGDEPGVVTTVEPGADGEPGVVTTVPGADRRYGEGSGLRRDRGR